MTEPRRHLLDGLTGDQVRGRIRKRMEEELIKLRAEVEDLKAENERLRAELARRAK